MRRGLTSSLLFSLDKVLGTLKLKLEYDGEDGTKSNANDNNTVSITRDVLDLGQ